MHAAAPPAFRAAVKPVARHSASLPRPLTRARRPAPPHPALRRPLVQVVSFLVHRPAGSEALLPANRNVQG